MSKFSAADTLELPVAERLQLVQDIWESIAATPEALELTEEDKRLIDERLLERGPFCHGCPHGLRAVSFTGRMHA